MTNLSQWLCVHRCLDEWTDPPGLTLRRPALLQVQDSQTWTLQPSNKAYHRSRSTWPTLDLCSASDHLYTANKTDTYAKQRHTVDIYASAAKVHLLSPWPWPMTSDLQNLSNTVTKCKRKRRLQWQKYSPCEVCVWTKVFMSESVVCV